MTERPARALIFDMDGTIVDNMGYHDEAFARFFAAKGQADVARYLGGQRRAAYPRVA